MFPSLLLDPMINAVWALSFFDEARVGSVKAVQPCSSSRAKVELCLGKRRQAAQVDIRSVRRKNLLVGKSIIPCVSASSDESEESRFSYLQ
jgi:hypothetical protein